MNDQWQDDLRNRMEHHEEPAPDGLWEGIAQLIPDGVIPGEEALRKHHSLWAWRAGAMSVAAAVAIVLFFIVRFNSADNQTGELFTEEKVIPQPQSQPPSVEITPVENRGEVSSIPARNTKVSTPVSTPTTTPEIAFAESEILVVEQPTEKIMPSRSESENRIIAPEDDDSSMGSGQLLAMTGNKAQQPPSKWQTSLSVSNFPTGVSETYTGYGTFALTETVENQYHFVSDLSREKAYTDVRHHQPLKFGLTFRYNINQKWSLISGLTYSKLSSELRSGSGNYFYDDRQTLHYVGIPLQVAYTFWQNRMISTYLSMGGLVEKNVAGSLSSNYYIDNQLEANTREKITTDHLQWSLHSALGLSYQITNNIGLYAEPGISYYFRNGNEFETIYTDNPFNFNLQIGLRFTLGE